jgi:diguanylate cyclase (GGDEF)-like protein
LTETFVRRHYLERFHEELERAVRHGFPLTVLMVDVDHFKRYNDELGHLVGDRTLREVARVIRENIRRVDVLGRLGGEEFIIAFPEIGKRQGFELAERIRSAIAHRRFHFYGSEAQVTVSIGATSFPDDVSASDQKDISGTLIPKLMDQADRALYRAKEEGRNRVVAFH